MRLGLFRKAKQDPDGADKAAARAAADRVKRAVRALLALHEDAAIAVNEILCADPACPGTETVILVMNPGQKTKAFKLQMAITDVTPEALEHAVFMPNHAVAPGLPRDPS